MKKMINIKNIVDYQQEKKDYKIIRLKCGII